MKNRAANAPAAESKRAVTSYCDVYKSFLVLSLSHAVRAGQAVCYWDLIPARLLEQKMRRSATGGPGAVLHAALPFPITPRATAVCVL